MTHQMSVGFLFFLFLFLLFFFFACFFLLCVWVGIGIPSFFAKEWNMISYWVRLWHALIWIMIHLKNDYVTTIGKKISQSSCLNLTLIQECNLHRTSIRKEMFLRLVVLYFGICQEMLVILMKSLDVIRAR